MFYRTLTLVLVVAALAAACSTGAAPTATPSTPAFATPTQEVADSAGEARPEDAAASAGEGDLALDLTPPTLGDFDPAAVAEIDLTAYPVMPQVTAHARAIYARSLESGHNPRVFSKVGDCMTAAAAFLTPFGSGEYDLGRYSALQPVLDHFGGVPARGEGFELDSFANPGIATASGFNAASVLDPTWADPNWCRPNESPLACEYRVSQPAIAIIMFGTNDVFYLEADRFDYHLRTVVLETINSDVVPVLNTFPTRPEYPEKSYLFNQIIVRIAQDYDLPLINLWLALQELPNQGVDTTETIHLTVPEEGSTGVFNEETLQAGYTYRNLITLQALDVIRQGLGMNAG